MKKITFLSVALVLTLATGNLVAVADTNPLTGKIIALDAGHDEVAYGASNVVDGVLVTEAEVNWNVVQALKAKLEIPNGAYVVVAERLSTRRDRVNDAVAKCAAFDLNNDGVGDKCDVLVSVHHNGSTDPTHDGTLTIYTQKSDQPLAKALYDSLLKLTNKPEGMLNGGYGMTVYKNLVSAITEAYYITNDEKAARYLNDLNADGTRKLVIEEVDAQVKGISDYFASQTGGKGGRPR